MKRGDACLAELKRKRLPSWLAPPIFRLAWQCGIDVSAPFYWSGLARVLFLGMPLAFTAFAMILGFDVFWRQSVLTLQTYIAAAFGMSLLAMLLYSVTLVCYRKKLAEMPSWEKL